MRRRPAAAGLACIVGAEGHPAHAGQLLRRILHTYPGRACAKVLVKAAAVHGGDLHRRSVRGCMGEPYRDGRGDACRQCRVAAIAIRRARPEWPRNGSISATRRGSDAGPLDIRERFPSNRSGGGVTAGICSLRARNGAASLDCRGEWRSDRRRASTAARSSGSSEPSTYSAANPSMSSSASTTKTILELCEASADHVLTVATGRPKRLEISSRVMP